MNTKRHQHFSLPIRLLTIVCLFITLGFNNAYAEGSPAYNFLNITPSPRIYGLGGINISAIDAGVLAAEQNPSLLGPEFSGSLAISYMRFIAESNFTSIAYTHSAGDNGAWGTSVRYFSYGDIKRTDTDGTQTGTYSPTDIALTTTYSHDITENLRGGIALKALYSSYDSYTAFAIATDIGINYYDPDRDLSLSATIVNLGGQIKRFNEIYDRLPLDVRLGWTQSFPGLPVRFSITAWNLTEWNLPYYHIDNDDDSTESRPGSSFGANLMRHLVLAADIIPSNKFNISIAYNYKTRSDMSTYQRDLLSGFSFGAGLDTGTWGINIAFARPHTGATTLMFSLTAGLNKLIGL